MSRMLEFFDDRSLLTVANRAHTAFSRIGSVDVYKQEQFLRGRIRIAFVTAHVSVHWTTANDQVNVYIRANSRDELNCAADVAMYRFLDSYRLVNTDSPAKSARKARLLEIPRLLVRAVTKKET